MADDARQPNEHARLRLELATFQRLLITAQERGAPAAELAHLAELVRRVREQLDAKVPRPLPRPGGARPA